MRTLTITVQIGSGLVATHSADQACELQKLWAPLADRCRPEGPPDVRDLTCVDNVTEAELDLIEELLRGENEENDFENVKISFFTVRSVRTRRW